MLHEKAIELFERGLPVLPTESEIEQRCLVVQQTWSDDERPLRLRPDWRPVRWELPVVTAADVFDVPD